MPKRGRAPGFRMPDEHRNKIKVSHIINRLQAHALGKVELMTATQVAAALGLLKKTMPDLAAVEHGGDVKMTYIASPEMPNDEWVKEFADRPLDS